MRRVTAGVQGTDWESVLYPEPLTPTAERWLADFRAECEVVDAVAEKEKTRVLEERKAKSVIYIDEVKKEKAMKERMNDEPDGAA